MKIKTFIILQVLLLLLPFSFCLAYENLDEIEARTSRKGNNTFYNGEDGVTNVWQPQTMIYKDTSTGHEVILWSQTDNKNTLRNATEYGWQPWSADGKRFTFVQEIDAGCYSRSAGYPWYIARSDGSYWRPACETANRTDVRRPYFDWSPIYPDVAYCVGYNNNGNSGLDENGVYRERISDTSISSSLIVDLIPGDMGTDRAGGIKHAITGDGRYFLTSVWAETEPFYIIQIEPSGSRQLKLAYNHPSLDTYWTNTPSSQGHWHDQCFTGNSAHGYWIYSLYTSGSWWRMRPWGTNDGPPDHTADHSNPYDWWEGTAAQKEIQPVNGKLGTMPNFVEDYWSHAQMDQWGTHVVFSDTEAVNVSPGVFDIENETQTGLYTAPGGAQYHTYTAWSDYTAQTCGSPPNEICSLLYNSLTNSDHVTVAQLHSATVNEFTKPAQSPDGTKIAMRSDWLNSGSGTADLFIGVVYFPYPPEITSVIATGGTVTVQFDWRHDQVSPRTYTTRGWPNESSDTPSPPREIQRFRLWRSSDKSTWTPITITYHDIFSRYDFSDGTWNGNSYWIITDGPGDGTWYYAVTSIEWSGIESRTLSNIFSINISGDSGAGSQDTLYPSSPGDLDNISTSDFYTSFNISYPELIRYYNIYAEDGSTPSVNQRNRIASISVNNCSNGSCSWVDWLGNTSGNTRYVVTAVDTQGNESDSSYVTNVSYSHRKSPATAQGQYTIEWGSGMAPPSGVELVPQPQ